MNEPLLNAFKNETSIEVSILNIVDINMKYFTACGMALTDVYMRKYNFENNFQ